MPFTHAGAYQAHGGFELRACVEPDDERRSAFQRRWSIAVGYRDLAEAAAALKDIDVISICSPTPCHDADLRLALGMRPSMVFCEKPLTGELATSIEIAGLYRTAGVPLTVNYTRRWDRQVRELQDQLEQGKWGRIRSVSGVYNKGLYNNGSHMLDLLALLLGPLSVQATGASIADMWEHDPSIPVMLASQDGIPITLNCADARDYALFELEIVTELGTIAMENGGLDWQLRHAGSSPTFVGYRSLGERHHVPGTLGGAALAAVTEIHAAAGGPGPFSCTADNAIAVQRLCETIRARSLLSSQSSPDIR